MHSDFSVFRERLQEACRVRNLTQDKLCSSITQGKAFKLSDGGGLHLLVTVRPIVVLRIRTNDRTHLSIILHTKAGVMKSQRLASPDCKTVAIVVSRKKGIQMQRSNLPVRQQRLTPRLSLSLRVGSQTKESETHEPTRAIIKSTTPKFATTNARHGSSDVANQVARGSISIR